MIEAASPQLTPPPTHPPPAPSALATVELRVKVVPTEAAIYLDGRLLEGSPFRGTFPRGGEHQLRVEAKGYETSTQTLSFEQDLTEANVSLSRVSAPQPQRRAQPRNDHNGRADANDETTRRRKRPSRDVDSELPY